jgi:DNA-binding transcriptional ArsR family regulator
MTMHSTALQTLADPMRLRIVETLQKGECAVNDIVRRLDIDQSGVSRHLRILSEAGFVEARAEGNKRIYALCPGPFQELDEWLSRYRVLWMGRLDRFGEELERRGQARQPR